MRTTHVRSKQNLGVRAQIISLLKNARFEAFHWRGNVVDVVTLCERLAGQDANVTTVPVSVLKLTRQLTRFFRWTNDVADRLAFSEVLSSNTVFSAPMTETYNLLGVEAKDIVTLEKYLQDYFTNILKKLIDLKAQSKQTDIYY